MDYKEIVSKLKETKRLPELNLDVLNKWYDYMESEIDLRIDSIKIEIEKTAQIVQEYCLNRIINTNKQFLKLNKKIVQPQSLKYSASLNQFVSLELRAFKTEKVFNSLNQLAFEESKRAITLENIGYFKNYFKYDHVRLDYMIQVKNSNCLLEFIELKSKIDGQPTILINDCETNSMLLLDKYGKSIDKMQLKALSKPINMTLNNRNEFIIFDRNLDLLIVFDENFKRLHQYKSPFDLYATQIASDTENANILYITYNCANRLCAYELTRTRLKLKNSCLVLTPWDIKAKDSQLFITSFTNNDTTNGLSNFISIVNKVSFEILNKIKFEDWLQPKGLYIDKYFNVWTCAYKLDHFKQSYSKSRYLVVINRFGQIIAEIRIEGVKWFSNFIVIENEFVIFSGAYDFPGLKFFQLG